MSRLGAVVTHAVAAIAVTVVLAGCASFRPTPATITVAAKDTRTRLESTVVGLRESPATGRLEELRREDIVDEYWVKSVEGEWYRVSKTDWQRARVGSVLDLHPALPERRAPTGPCTTSSGAWWPCP